jgi:hypothetical protein
MPDLSRDALRVLVVLCSANWEWDSGNCWRGFGELARDANLSLDRARLATHELRDHGLVKYSWMVDDDYRPCGSGYFVECDLYYERLRRRRRVIRRIQSIRTERKERLAKSRRGGVPSFEEWDRLPFSEKLAFLQRS